MKVSFFPLILLLLSATVPAAQKVEKARPAQSIAELQQHLQKILSETHTPGLAVAIVHSDGPEWIAGLGKADVATGRAVTAQTLFRIGSTSKAFASLSILKLANQGKLSLDDPVRNLVPEVWFENRWEANDPVRVVNLLEHTTGWDDIHLREFAFDAPPSMDLRRALEYGRDTRVSRWPPGTRMAYCNTGPAVAAYIVQKITGQPFEEYVQQNFFIPIGMKTATYFKPSPLSNAILYNDIGKSPYRYWNILYRPSGAVNASAEDMAAYVQFYLDRGKVNGRQVMPAADIDRMESPSSTWAAKAGLKNGYGLSNYWSVRDGFTYHGHDGAVLGGLTDVGYMPDYGVGYFYSINSSNSTAYNEIGRAIRAYITLKLARPAVPDPGSLPTDVHDFMGFYEPDSPRIEMIHFLDRLTGISEVYFQDGKMRIASLQGKRTFIPVSGRFFDYSLMWFLWTAYLASDRRHSHTSPKPNSEAGTRPLPGVYGHGAGLSTSPRGPLLYFNSTVWATTWLVLSQASKRRRTFPAGQPILPSRRPGAELSAGRALGPPIPGLSSPKLLHLRRLQIVAQSLARPKVRARFLPECLLPIPC